MTREAATLSDYRPDSDMAQKIHTWLNEEIRKSISVLTTQNETIGTTEQRELEHNQQLLLKQVFADKTFIHRLFAELKDLFPSDDPYTQALIQDQIKLRESIIQEAVRTVPVEAILREVEEFPTLFDALTWLEESWQAYFDTDALRLAPVIFESYLSQVMSAHSEDEDEDKAALLLAPLIALSP